MPFVVVYDANALYGNAQRDLLIRIAQSGLVQAKWTDQILDEMLSNLGKKRPDIPPEKLGTLRELMNKAVRDCLVTGYEPLIESLKLPDPDDRHVLAAAVRELACPARWAISSTATPDSDMTETNVCRSSRGAQTPSMPACLHRSRKSRRTWEASSGVPTLVVNTRPVSCHSGL